MLEMQITSLEHFEKLGVVQIFYSAACMRCRILDTKFNISANAQIFKSAQKLEKFGNENCL